MWLRRSSTINQSGVYSCAVPRLQPAIPFIPIVNLPFAIALSLNLEKRVVCCTANSHLSSVKQHKDCGARLGRSGRHVVSYVLSFDLLFKSSSAAGLRHRRFTLCITNSSQMHNLV